MIDAAHFDPLAWLADFASAGGCWSVTPDGALWFGWPSQGAQEARELYRALMVDPERSAAVEAALVSRAA